MPVAGSLIYTPSNILREGNMKRRFQGLAILLLVPLAIFSGYTPAQPAQGPDLEFDHNHTFTEVADYLNAVVGAYPNIAKLHKIGKSYLGKDLLVLEITNRSTGTGLEKPGYWLDGNLHSSEVMGAEVCLNTIDTLVKGYGRDDSITSLPGGHPNHLRHAQAQSGRIGPLFTQARWHAEQRQAA